MLISVMTTDTGWISSSGRYASPRSSRTWATPSGFEMVLENHGDPINRTISIDILANGKEVSGKLFTFGWSNEPGKIYRETFQWNTSGVTPGEYRIRGEAFVWGDVMTRSTIPST